jgi:hypothetical protein
MNGDPYNKLYLPSNNSGYLTNSGEGKDAWGILTDPYYGNFQVLATL